jgi:hypothetical protein
VSVDIDGDIPDVLIRADTATGRKPKALFTLYRDIICQSSAAETGY